MKPLATPVLIDLDRALRDAAEPAYRATIRDHFRSNVDHFHGVRMPVIRECATAVVSPHVSSLLDRWTLCDELIRTGIFEHKIAAFHLAREARRTWDGTELTRFSRWLLKDSSKSRPEEVREFVETAGDRMHSIVRRTALSKLAKP